MSAVRFDSKTKELSLVKQDLPKQLLQSEVLIKVAYSGVCGTDIHISEGHFPCQESGLILGHEFSGVVISVGSEVDHVAPGDNVVADPNNACNICSYCTSKRYHLCKKEYEKSNLGVFRDGGWATYCVVPAGQVYKLPSTISLELGGLCEPLSCLAHGYDRIRPIDIGQNIIVQGAGIIGNLWAALLRAKGHKRVTVTEVQESRRKLFENLGTGFECVEPKALTGKDGKFDLIIDCSGAPPALENALNLLGPGGKLCIFGVSPPHARISLSPYELYKKEITIVAVLVNPFSFPAAIGLLESFGTKYLAYDKLGVKTYPLAEYETALKELKTGAIAKAMYKIE